MIYKERIADKILNQRLGNFGAVLIEGPKACGKTTTAKQLAKSVVEFQDEEKRDKLLDTALLHPSGLLIGDTPRLFDEWQDAPSIWGAVRKSVDERGQPGLYILTGSSPQFVKTPHTGTLRISSMTMLPMSLYETEESNGSVSLADLFDRPEEFDDCRSDMSNDDVIYAICRGGWPQSRYGNVADPLSIAREFFEKTCGTDISNIENSKKRPDWTEAILRSYARNICTIADNTTIYRDVTATNMISENSFSNYVSALKKLYVLQDIPAWSPAIRSRTSIRTSMKHNFVDPSVAVSALGIGPDYFNTDYRTLGFLFESLCIRDLKIYSSPVGGKVSYFRDRNKLEADCVLHLPDGRYALIEFKYGYKQIEEGAGHLCEIERLIKKRNEGYPEDTIRLPDLKIVITATEEGYRRDDGVFVIPIGCLKD